MGNHHFINNFNDPPPPLSLPRERERERLGSVVISGSYTRYNFPEPSDRELMLVQGLYPKQPLGLLLYSLAWLFARREQAQKQKPSPTTVSGGGGHKRQAFSSEFRLHSSSPCSSYSSRSSSSFAHLNYLVRGLVARHTELCIIQRQLDQGRGG